MTENAYKAAGVDIDAGAELVERIKPHVRRTARAGMMGGIGGFGALFDVKAAGFKDPLLVSSTDGVGTKLRIAIETGRHDTVGVDLVAMCVNDLIVQGAEPLFFLDYFATGKLNNDVAERVIKGIAAGCEQAGCALVGGETAEMPGMYAAGDYDLAGFTVGAVERDSLITGEMITDGDVVLGLASSGPHSNGYSLIRKLAEKVGYDSPSPFGHGDSLGHALLTPTRIYVKPILKALTCLDGEGCPVIRGMAHITGGGLSENIPRILPDSLAAVLNAGAWPFLPVFGWLAETGGLGAAQMARTFNCGIGMVIVCTKDGAERVRAVLEDEGEAVYEIGRIRPRKTAAAVTIDNTEQSWGLKN